MSVREGQCNAHVLGALIVWDRYPLLLLSMDQPISLDTVVNFLVSTPLFDGLDPAERAEVVRIMEVRRLTDGEEVFHEGDPGDAWYVIFEGQARVLKEADTGAWEIRVMERGTCFGEMAILDREARSATVLAMGPLTAFRFRRQRFEQLLDQGSLGAYKLVLGMARMLSQRHRQLTQQLSELTSHNEPVAARAGAPGLQASDAHTAVAQYQISE
jgi:CRP/FNR family transcriptional regulator, cyclic AMP receptor protein